jgi:assimilatory nitrate reductase catalytic subunit
MVQPATDPISGQPEAKATPARIEPMAVSHYGFALSRQPLATTGLAYWSASRTAFGQILHFALNCGVGPASAWPRSSLPCGDRLEFSDAAAGAYRAAVLRQERLESVVVIGPGPKLPSPEWLKSQFDRDVIPAAERRTLLAGRPISGAANDGPIVCVCFQVGAAAISTAAATGHGTVEAVGKALGAGTNCGSCIPELRRLIAAGTPAREPEHEPV